MYLNYNKDGADLYENFGLTKERGHEVRDQAGDAMQEVANKAMEKDENISSADLVNSVIGIPQTPEEAFFLGYVVGGFIEKRFRANPIEQLLSGLGLTKMGGVS